MKRNFGINPRSYIIPPGSEPTGDRLGVRPFSSGLKETISGGFLITFACFVGALFGVITFFASLLIEPSFDPPSIQYHRYVQADR